MSEVNFEYMCEAFSRIIDMSRDGAGPFYNPIISDAELALRELRLSVSVLQSARAQPTGEAVAWLIPSTSSHGFTLARPHWRGAFPVYRTAPHAQVPEGWQVVPKDLTPEMQDCLTGLADVHNDLGYTAVRAYQAMLAAAPQPKDNNQ